MTPAPGVEGPSPAPSPRFGRAQEKLLDAAAGLPTTVIQAVLAAGFLWLLGYVGGDWIRCTFFDTTGCLARISVTAPTCKRLDPGAVGDAHQKYQPVSGRIRKLDSATATKFAWFEHHVRLHNVGLSGLDSVKVRYRPTEGVVGYAVREGDTDRTLEVPDDAKAWVRLDIEHFVLAAREGLLQRFMSATETVDLWMLVAMSADQTQGWLEMLCEGETRCQVPYLRVLLPGC